MSRKDYILIAEALRQLRLDLTRSSSVDYIINNVLDETAIALADALQRDNDRFNRQRFIEACKP